IGQTLLRSGAARCASQCGVSGWTRSKFQRVVSGLRNGRSAARRCALANRHVRSESGSGAMRIRLLLAVVFLASCATPKPEKQVIRVGVIGGMMRSGLWPELAKRFEQKHGYKVEVALSGNRDLLADAFVAGKLDLVAMHAGEVASNLVA